MIQLHTILCIYAYDYAPLGQASTCGKGHKTTNGCTDDGDEQAFNHPIQVSRRNVQYYVPAVTSYHWRSCKKLMYVFVLLKKERFTDR